MKKIFLVFLNIGWIAGFNLYSQTGVVQFTINRDMGISLGALHKQSWNIDRLGFGLSVQLNFFLKDRISVGAEAGFLDIKGKPASDALRVKSYSQSFTAFVNYYFPPTKVLRPYTALGAGANAETLTFTLQNSSMQLDVYDVVLTPHVFVGTGLELKYSRHTSVTVDVRYKNIFSDGRHYRLDRQKDRLKGNTHLLALSVGARFDMVR